MRYDFLSSLVFNDNYGSWWTDSNEPVVTYPTVLVFQQVRTCRYSSYGYTPADPTGTSAIPSAYATKMIVGSYLHHHLQNYQPRLRGPLGPMVKVRMETTLFFENGVDYENNLSNR